MKIFDLSLQTTGGNIKWTRSEKATLEHASMTPEWLLISMQSAVPLPWPNLHCELCVQSTDLLLSKTAENARKERICVDSAHEHDSHPT